MASANQLEHQQSTSDAATDNAPNPPAPILPTDGLSKLPGFAEPKDVSARAFLDLLQSIQSTFKWDDVQTINAAISAFKGKARDWYEATLYREPKTFATYDEFERAFLERFKPSKNSATQVRTLSNLYQRPEESVVDFLDRIDVALIAICREAMPKAAAKRAGAAIIQGHFTVLLFLNGLLPSIKASVESQYKVDDAAEYAVKRAVLLEVAQRSESSYREKFVQPVTVAAYTNRAPPRGRGGRAFYRGNQRQRYTRSQQPPPNQTYQAQFNYNANPPSKPQSTPPHIIAARKRWVKCLKCLRWGKHYAKECPYPASNVAEIATDQPPATDIFDEHFDNTTMQQAQTNNQQPN